MNTQYVVVRKVDCGWSMACGIGFSTAKEAVEWRDAHLHSGYVAKRLPGYVGGGIFVLNDSDVVASPAHK